MNQAGGDWRRHIGDTKPQEEGGIKSKMIREMVNCCYVSRFAWSLTHRKGYNGSSRSLIPMFGFWAYSILFN